MRGRDVPIETGEGTMTTFVVHPEGDGPFPVVLFFMDAPGKREELHRMARRLAGAGYYVMLPNLFYRQTPAFELDFTSEEAFGEMSRLMRGVGNRMVVRDAAALLAYADADERADGRRVGSLGFCMSGPFAICVAAAYPDRVRAAVSAFGVLLAVDASDSPHLVLGDVRGELYVACAQHDDYAPPEMVERFRSAMAEAGTRGALEYYPGTHHGFAFPDRGGFYDEQAAERLWSTLCEVFARNLQAHDQ